MPCVSRFIYCFTECRYAECCYADCRGTVKTSINYECRYAECCYADCRGTVRTSINYVKGNSLIVLKSNLRLVYPQIW
jgi:hypothetical protein